MPGPRSCPGRCPRACGAARSPFPDRRREGGAEPRRRRYGPAWLLIPFADGGRKRAKTGHATPHRSSPQLPQSPGPVVKRRSMFRRILLAALVCAGCSHRQRLPDGSIAFLEVRSQHFRLRTDLSREAAARALTELERVRNAFLVSLFPPGLDEATPLDVVALAEVEDMQEFAPPRTLGFFAQSASGQRMIAISGDDPAGSAVLRHELAHHLLYLAMPRQPRWFSEG